LSEVPPMAVKVLCIVLTLTKHVIRRLREDLGACLSRSLEVTQRVLNSHLHDDGMVGNDHALADRKTALSGAHLNSVIGNSQSNGETESLAEPFPLPRPDRVIGGRESPGKEEQNGWSA